MHWKHGIEFPSSLEVEKVAEGRMERQTRPLTLTLKMGEGTIAVKVSSAETFFHRNKFGGGGGVEGGRGGDRADFVPLGDHN